MTNNRPVPGIWRAGMLAATIGAWLVVLGLGLHESSDPSVLGRWSPGWTRLVLAAGLGASALSACNLPRPLAWLHRVRFQIVGLGAMVFFTLAMMEGAIRALDLLGVSYYEESKRYHLEKVADDDLIYAHRPSWSTRYQSVDVSFNEYGFRDDPIDAKGDDELRILFLGDSVTFGWGVAQNAIFAARLERILADELERPVVVVNTGVGSYNTVQQLAVVERYGERLSPDLVLLLYVYNDVEEHARPFDPHAQFDLSNYNAAGKVDVMLGKSWLYRLVRHVREARSARPGTGSRPPERTPGWHASMTALEAIASWSADRDLRFATYV